MNRVFAVALLAACQKGSPSATDASEPAETGGTPLAGGPTFEALSFFQAVEVPVLVGDREVPSADRNAPLVVDRPAVLRARVAVPAEGAVDALQVVVDVTSGGSTETFDVTATPADGWVVELPADVMTEDATFVVRLSAGGVVHDRFPDTAEAALDARVTGPLAVRLVPFVVNGFTPDTSAAVVEGYRAALMATYPVTDVQITVADAEVWSGALDLGAINVRVGELQEQAMFAGEVDWDVYYYGMVTGVATRDAFTGITGTSENGGSEPLTRAYFAAGAAFGDQRSEDTLIHELGHAHRLLHTPCDGEDDPDPAYPYDGGIIGTEGYDLRTGTFVPAGAFDLMGYCYPRWISDYSYAKLADHVAGAQQYSGPE